MNDFLRRDWKAIERSKDEHWVQWLEGRDAAAGMRLGDELRQQMIAMRPDWPSDEDRAEDLRDHLRVLEALRRVRRSRG